MSSELEFKIKELEKRIYRLESILMKQTQIEVSIDPVSQDTSNTRTLKYINKEMEQAIKRRYYGLF